MAGFQTLFSINKIVEIEILVTSRVTAITVARRNRVAVLQVVGNHPGGVICQILSKETEDALKARRRKIQEAVRQIAIEGVMFHFIVILFNTPTEGVGIARIAPNVSLSFVGR